jgi:signal transduction histidine kinase
VGIDVTGALQVQTERALREKNPDRQSEALSHALRAVTRLRRLTQQLLTLTRSDASAAGTLVMGDIDLAELARHELERWANVAIARNIDLGYDGPDSGIKVRGEEQLLCELSAISSTTRSAMDALTARSF